MSRSRVEPGPVQESVWVIVGPFKGAPGTLGW